jgi:hypothetical protein
MRHSVQLYLPDTHLPMCTEQALQARSNLGRAGLSMCAHRACLCENYVPSEVLFLAPYSGPRNGDGCASLGPYSGSRSGDILWE